jgi:hypothetical protein
VAKNLIEHTASLLRGEGFSVLCVKPERLAFVQLIALRLNDLPRAIVVCSPHSFVHRVGKAVIDPGLRAWMGSGGQAEVFIWDTKQELGRQTLQASRYPIRPDMLKKSRKDLGFDPKEDIEDEL